MIECKLCDFKAEDPTFMLAHMMARHEIMPDKMMLRKSLDGKSHTIVIMATTGIIAQ